MEEASSLIPLGNSLYFDSHRKLIVEKKGEVMKVVETDRRRQNRPVTVEKRVLPSEDNSQWVSLGQGLYFDKQQKVLMKKMGSRMVLYSRDRRKERRPISQERRKQS